VRFFYRRSFGEIVQNLKRHYENIEIVSDGRSKFDTLPLWALLRETVNQKSSDKSPLPQLAGDVMKSMLSGCRYPETLMNQTMLRIRAEHEINRGKAGIIKAYLIRNTENLPDRESIMEVAQVSLNADSSYCPYVLGRLFAVLEGTQQAANPGINATIKDRFFNSACATPAAVFPILLKLSNSHLKKLDTGKAVWWSKQIGDLIERLSTVPDIVFNGRTDETAAPHILSVRVRGVRAEVLLHALEDRGIYVSAGSACSSNHPRPSETLMAIGVPQKEMENSIRISLSVMNTMEEMDAAAETIAELVPFLRRFVRK
jgi:CRISPR-associated protein Cas8c/Csd1 subtype I-C